MIRLQSVQNKLHYPIPGICAILALIYLSPFVSSWLNYVAFLICIYRLVKYDERIFSVDYCCLISVATVFSLPGGLSFVVVISLIAGSLVYHSGWTGCGQCIGVLIAFSMLPHVTDAVFTQRSCTMCQPITHYLSDVLIS